MPTNAPLTYALQRPDPPLLKPPVARSPALPPLLLVFHAGVPSDRPVDHVTEADARLCALWPGPAPLMPHPDSRPVAAPTQVGAGGVDRAPDQGSHASPAAAPQGPASTHDAAPGSTPEDRPVIATAAEPLLAWLRAQAAASGAPEPLPLGPVSLFCDPPSQALLQALAEAGLTGWWPLQALDAASLGAALQFDQARWARARDARERHAQTVARFEDRVWVDRAKGVLMNARGLSEDDAFALLRTTSMHTHMRLAELARGVLASAHWADAINQAGQLRMLSQRVIKLMAQRLAELDARGSRQAQKDAAQRVQAILAFLDGLAAKEPAAAAGVGPSKATSIDTGTGIGTDMNMSPPGSDPDPAPSELDAPVHWPTPLAAVHAAWAPLALALDARVSPSQLREADARAEALLAAADRLTTALEACSGRQMHRIINLCGRQRMLVQRLAKQALIAGMAGLAAQSPGAGLAAASTSATTRGHTHPVVDEALLDLFEASLRSLREAPIATPDIRRDLDEAEAEWQRLLRGLATLPGMGSRSPTGQEPPDEPLLVIARASDSLLGLFDRLTRNYEHSLQVIMA